MFGKWSVCVILCKEIMAFKMSFFSSHDVICKKANVVLILSKRDSIRYLLGRKNSYKYRTEKKTFPISFNFMHKSLLIWIVTTENEQWKYVLNIIHNIDLRYLFRFALHINQCLKRIVPSRVQKRVSHLIIL